MESYQLEAGTHRFPFTFVLPSTVPSSFEGILGYVRYTADAAMVRPWKFNHVTRSPFTVINLVDLNLASSEYKVTLHLMLHCICMHVDVVVCFCQREITKLLIYLLTYHKCFDNIRHRLRRAVMRWSEDAVGLQAPSP